MAGARNRVRRGLWRRVRAATSVVRCRIVRYRASLMRHERRALPQSVGVRDADGTLTSCDAVFVRPHDAGGTYASYGATMCDNTRR